MNIEIPIQALALLFQFSPEFDERTFFQILADNVGERNAHLAVNGFQLLTGIDHKGWMSRTITSFKSMFYLNISISSWAMISQIEHSSLLELFTIKPRVLFVSPFTYAYDILRETQKNDGCYIPAGATNESGQIYVGREKPGIFSGRERSDIHYSFATVCFNCCVNKRKREIGCIHMKRPYYTGVQNMYYSTIPQSIAKSLLQNFAKEYAYLLLASMITNQPIVANLHNSFLALRQEQLLRKVRGGKPYPVLAEWKMPILPGKFLEMFPGFQKFFKVLNLPSSGNAQKESVAIPHSFLSQSSKSPSRKEAMIGGAMSLFISAQFEKTELNKRYSPSTLVFRRVCSGLAADKLKSFSTENQKEFCTQILRYLQLVYQSEMNDLLIKIYLEILVHLK
jgi:hypothetical protein